MAARVTEFLGQMTAAGVRPGIILDDPTLPARPEECISRTGSIAACEPSRSSALAAARLLTSADRAAVASTRPSTPVFAPDDVLCDQAGCPLEIDNRLLYADTNHLLFGATRLMEPELAGLLHSVLGTSS